MKKQSKLSKKRRIQGKTNYKKRLLLLRGKKLRIVVRKTNKYVIIQIIESKNALDKVLYHVTTKELLNYGWPKDKQGSLKSIPACYLGGYLIGKKAKELKQDIILDMGLIPNTKGSRVYSVIKGAIDSGLKIAFNEKSAPSKERINGADTKLSKEELNKVKEAIK